VRKHEVVYKDGLGTICRISLAGSEVGASLSPVYGSFLAIHETVDWAIPVGLP